MTKNSLKDLKFYLGMIDDLRKRIVYIRENIDEIESSIVSGGLLSKNSNIYVNTVSTLYKYYKNSEDNICKLFNALNWDIKIKNIPDDVSEIYSDYVKNKNRKYDIRKITGINSFAFSEDGYNMFYTLYRMSKDSNYIKPDNSYNHQNILGTDVNFITPLKINDNSYSFVAIHGGGDVRSNYYRYLMVKNLSSYDVFELGQGVFTIPFNFIPNKKNILKEFSDLEKCQKEFFSKKSRADAINLFLNNEYPKKYFSINGEGFVTDDESGSQSFMLTKIDDKFLSSKYLLKIEADSIYFYE